MPVGFYTVLVVLMLERRHFLPSSTVVPTPLVDGILQKSGGGSQAALCRILVKSNTSGGIMGAHGSNLDDILEEDMHHWYTKFMRESPSGLMTLFELKTTLEMNGMTEEASSYVDQVFFTFDMDGDGYIDFVEYIAAISLLLKGEVNQKLKWYFKLFDQDGNGKIDKDELETIFKAIQDITRSYDIPPEEIVTLIYERIDVKGEGELTLEEFITGAREHPDIMDMLTKMMDLTHVLEIIIKGQTKKKAVK
ncbi:hypothetical protein Q8A73_007047 [Channa argus]|nr:hypothetical protein Q8A73_007047 [Channa argus]